MKFFYLIFFVIFITSAKAGSYFVSSNIGDDARFESQAQNPATPWKTIKRLNTFNKLKPGDSILFKSGETFYGNLIPNASGTSGKVIYYGSYGKGAKPIISGFTQLVRWTLYSGNIYYADLDVSNLNMVTLNGVVRGMGRYPNRGYLNYESHTANTSITDKQLPGKYNWTGAEVVIRKFRWILDRHIIKNHSGSTLIYNATSPYGNNNAYSPVDGNGYFIQAHLKTLDKEGEWYYDNAANRFYMHFGAGTPSGKTVKVVTVDQLVTLNSSRYISFNNVNFDGGNYALVLNSASNVTTNNCDFNQQGATSIYGITCSNITINGGCIQNTLNNGVWIETGGYYILVDGVAISNIGTIAGAGRSGDGAQQGIAIRGNNTIITNCKVTNIGYNGINFYGDNVLVENNFVDSFCKVKDDGGGIYTVISSNEIKATNRIIRNNIILNAIGAYIGAEAFFYEAFGKAAAIYLDGHSNHTSVTGNILAHGSWDGIFINGNSDNTITNNLIYDFVYQLHLGVYVIGSIRNTTITGNTFIAKTSKQKTIFLDMHANDNPALYGTFNNNLHATPVNDTNSIRVGKQYNGGGGDQNMSLVTWKSTFHQDANSSKFLITTTSTAKINMILKTLTDATLIRSGIAEMMFMK